MVKKLLGKHIPIEYSLATYHRSNQDTCLVNKPVVMEGDWVQSGDLLGDCSASIGGELAIGQNILVAYMPWEGYNYEDAILISERLVYDDLYTSVHIERYEIETKETKLGPEQITKEIPNINEQEISHLDKNGIAKIGCWIVEGTILVGKVTPITKKKQSNYEKLVYSLLQKEIRPVTDSSLRAPKGIKAKVLDVQILNTNSITTTKKEFKKRTTKLVILSATHLKSSSNTSRLSSKLSKLHTISNLPWHKPNKPSTNLFSTQSAKKTIKSFKMPNLVNGIVQKGTNITENLKGPSNVHVYLVEKRKLQIGDKMAGRHGNKGIISQILPRQDMPYLPNGVPIDIVLNPLGVPSRMNVGQIYECLLGLAGKHLGEHFKIAPFDEIYGPEASRSFVYSKLYEARKKSGLNWLFNPNSPGKMRLFDGRTGDSFDQPITVGMAYMLKLVHMVDDKIHARSIGPYSAVTQQPLRGRSSHGGQRVGEMEVWAIEGYGAAFVLLELLTIKSDDLTGRLTLWANLIHNKEISIGSPESFKVLICELKALCLDMGLFRADPKLGLLHQPEETKEDSIRKKDKNVPRRYKEIKTFMRMP